MAVASSNHYPQISKLLQAKTFSSWVSFADAEVKGCVAYYPSLMQWFPDAEVALYCQWQLLLLLLRLYCHWKDSPKKILLRTEILYSALNSSPWA